MIGPFGIAGEQFSMVLHKNTATSSSPATLKELQILDHKGSLVYQKNFPDAAEHGSFIGATAELLPYANGNALLIRYQPNSPQPQPAAFWQVFGFIQGHLRPYSGPVQDQNLGPQGLVMGAVARGSAMAMPMLQQGDPVELRMWTGNFYVIIPMLVDWSRNRVLPAQRCYETGGPGLQERGCDMRVEAVRKSSAAEMTFVRMFREPQEFEGGARHVVVKRNSQILYLTARSMVRWSTKDDFLQATLPDLWLKVLVDNDDDKEGWIHTEEEFEAVGLPSAGEPQ